MLLQKTPITVAIRDIYGEKKDGCPALIRVICQMLTLN